jgi:hypothetical protein
MHPVAFAGWLRLRVGLAAFLGGSISIAILPLLGGLLDWYGLIALGLAFSGMFYLNYVGEWLRVLYKQRNAPETRRRIVRVGTPVFFVGIVANITFALPWIGLFLSQGDVLTAFLIAYGLMIGVGAIIIAFGIFENWKALASKLEESSKRALRMMKEAGCVIHDDPLWIVLDPGLQAPAETYPGGGESVILVSPWYVDTKWFGGIDNILVHEMAHIYRRETNHPSENQEIIKEIKAHYKTAMQYSTKGFQLKTLVRSMYNLQEVLTNDLAFRTLEFSNMAWIGPTGESLQALTRSRPMRALGATRKRWSNAALIANNAIYIAQMDRHKIPDTGDKAKIATQKLLSSLPKEAVIAYCYFYQLALELKEDITQEDLRGLLQNYAARLVELAENS